MVSITGLRDALSLANMDFTLTKYSTHAFSATCQYAHIWDSTHPHALMLDTLSALTALLQWQESMNGLMAVISYAQDQHTTAQLTMHANSAAAGCMHPLIPHAPTAQPPAALQACTEPNAQLRPTPSATSAPMHQ